MTNRWRRFVWLSIGIDFQYQSIDKLVSIGCRLMEPESTHKKNTTLYAVIINTFHFNVYRRTILSSFSLTLMPRPQEYVFFFFDNLKVCSMGQSIDFKKRKVVASCLHRKILVTEVVLLQTMKLPAMNKAAIPSLIITNLIVLKTKITYIQTKKIYKGANCV